MADDAERSLKLQLRGRTVAAGSVNCDQCRRLKASCSKTQPCVRCCKAGRACTFDDKLIKCGRMSRAERLSFAASGLQYHTFRDQLRSKRERRTRQSQAQKHSRTTQQAKALPSPAPEPSRWPRPPTTPPHHIHHGSTATSPRACSDSSALPPADAGALAPAPGHGMPAVPPPSVQAALADPRITPLLLGASESAAIARTATSATPLHGTPLPPEFAHDTALRYYRFPDTLVSKPLPLYIECAIPAGQHGILYIHAAGFLVLAHAERFAPTYQDVLAREWETEGPGGHMMSPFVPLAGGSGSAQQLSDPLTAAPSPASPPTSLHHSDHPAYGSDASHHHRHQKQQQQQHLAGPAADPVEAGSRAAAVGSEGAATGTPALTPLWPAGHYTEADYDTLRERAATLLSCPVVPQLLECSFFEQEGYLTLYGPNIAANYAFACRALRAGTSSGAHRHAGGGVCVPDTVAEQEATRQRFVQAQFLFNLAYAARHEDKVRLVLDDGDWCNNGVDGRRGGTEIGASPWALAVDGFKLAWALCQPRCGLRLTGSEQCVDALVAINMAKMITVTNPRCRNLSTAVLFLDPELHLTLRAAVAHDPVAQELYKRVLAHRMWAQQKTQLHAPVSLHTAVAGGVGEGRAGANVGTLLGGGAAPYSTGLPARNSSRDGSARGQLDYGAPVKPAPTNPFVPILDTLIARFGPLVALPNEAREYGCGGLASRWRIGHFFARVSLVRLTEVTLQHISRLQRLPYKHEMPACTGVDFLQGTVTAAPQTAMPPLMLSGLPRGASAASASASPGKVVSSSTLPSPGQSASATPSTGTALLAPMGHGSALPPSQTAVSVLPEAAMAANALAVGVRIIDALVGWSEAHLTASADVPLAGTFDAWDLKLMMRDRAREYVHVGRRVLATLVGVPFPARRGTERATPLSGSYGCVGRPGAPTHIANGSWGMDSCRSDFLANATGYDVSSSARGLSFAPLASLGYGGEECKSLIGGQGIAAGYPVAQLEAEMKHATARLQRSLTNASVLAKMAVSP